MYSFHCLFCHGYEDRGQESVGILAVGDCAATGPALHLARMARRLAAKVTIYTDGAFELSQALETPLKAGGFELDSRRILKLAPAPGESGVSMNFDDGTDTTEGFLVSMHSTICARIRHYVLMPKQVHKPKTEVNGEFAQQLSLELTSDGDIAVKPPFYESVSAPGVFAVGDCGSMGKAVSQATSTGLWCSSGLVAQLQAQA